MQPAAETLNQMGFCAAQPEASNLPGGGNARDTRHVGLAVNHNPANAFSMVEAQPVVVIGATADGQLWRVLYPDTPIGSEWVSPSADGRC